MINLNLSPSAKLRILHLINHIAVVYGLFYGQWWMWLVGFGVWNIIASFGVSIGMHRYLSHKSFTTYLWFERFCILISCLSLGGSPLAWVGAHRMHHAYVETVKDPHSVRFLGFWRTYFHLWGNISIPRRFIKDLLDNRFLVFIHRNYYKIIFIWAGVLYLIDPLVGVFIFSLPCVFSFHAFGQINAFTHLWGYRNYETSDDSRNNFFVNILTCGEGWHNNHHKYPNSYRIGFRMFEYDMSAWILEKFKLMKTFKGNYNKI